MDTRARQAITGMLLVLTFLGIALIYIGSRQTSQFAHDLAMGVGIATGPAALVALLFRMFLLDDIEREFAAPLTREVRRAIDAAVPRQVTALLEDYRAEIDDIGALRRGGMLRSFPNRKEAIADFVDRCNLPPKLPALVVVGSSLKGVLPDEYSPFAELVQRDPGAVKFVLTHPVVADLRARQEGRRLTAIGEEIVDRLRLLERIGVPATNVYLYRGAPTCFSIMCPELKIMLLNPYPYEAVAWDAPCLLVRWDEGKGYLYESFRVHHFGRIEARSVMTEQLDDLTRSADELESMLGRYKEVVELVEELAPLRPSQTWAEQVVAHDRDRRARVRRVAARGAAEDIAVDVYIGGDDDHRAEEILRRVDDVVEQLGYYRPETLSIERGSIFRRARAAARRAMSSDELADRLALLEQAVEVQLVGKHISGIDRQMAEAVSWLIQSLESVPTACVRLKSIVIVKYTLNEDAVVLARSLSAKEMRAIECYPEMTQKPERFLDSLALAVDRLEADEA